MPEFDNTNRGAMFKNNEKRDGRSPDYRGTLNVNGAEFWISGWIKTAGAKAKNPGSKFMSVSVQPKEQDGPSLADVRVKHDEMGPDEDIPF